MLAAAVLVALAAALAIVAVAYRSGSSAPQTRPRPVSATSVARYDAVQRLLAARSAAITDHNRAAFMATVDPRSPAFREEQSRMFANLAAVSFTSWSYSLTSVGRRPPPDARHYGDPVWAPQLFLLHYRLAHFDPRPTNLRQYPTFVERSGHWYLASLSDYVPRGLVSATDLWDYERVSVVRRPDVLVLGPRDQRTTMAVVARDVQSAIGEVTSVWGSSWSQRAVVLLPRTMHEMALIDDDHEDLSDIAALTSAEVQTTAGHPAPVGDRITLNPHNWPRLSRLGAQVVLRHELTHVATEASTGTRTPTWLVEGFADYVGFKFADVAVSVSAAELRHAIRSGHLPARLPSNASFRGGDSRLAVHYEAAWFACRAIARRFGQPALVRFYRQVGRSTLPSQAAVRDALIGVLGLHLKAFVALWHSDMRAELG